MKERRPVPDYKKGENVVTRRIAGETLLIPISGKLADLKQVFSLEGIAPDIWKFLDGEHSLEDIADAIVSEYEVDRETAARDIAELADKLLDAGLVGVAEPS